MHFINEYEMTKKRFVKWSIPVFYRLPIFYIMVVVFIVSGYAWYYFAQHDAPQRWQTLAAFMMLMCLYRGILYKPLSADKQYRLTKMNMYNNQPWMCKVDVSEGGIKVMSNGKVNAHIKWDKVVKFQEAKSYLDLVVQSGEQARMDKACFTRGDAESFKAWMAENHPELPLTEVAPKANV